MSTGSVSGIILDELGNPAAGVVVRLMPSDYDPVTGISNITVLTDTTNGMGQYTFGRLDSATYNVEAIDPSNGSKLLIYALEVSGDSVEAPLGILEQPGTAVIPWPEFLNSDALYLYVPGTGIHAYISHADMAAGEIRLESVPAGIIPGIYYVSDVDTGAAVLLASDVTVNAGETVRLPTYFTWQYSAKITINTTSSGADVAENIYNYPLLVRLDSSSVFEEAELDGSDIRFSKSDGTMLPYEIEHWDKTAQSAHIWVRMDTVYGNNDSQYIMIHWGRADAQDQSNGAAVFDTSENYAGVWHLYQDPTGTSPQFTDASAEGNHGLTRKYIPADASVATPLYKGIRFDGREQYISTSREYTNPGIFTLSMWCRLDSAAGGVLMDFASAELLKDSSYGGHDRVVWLDSLGYLRFGVFEDSLRLEDRQWAQHYEKVIRSDETWFDTDWHHVTAVFGPGNQALYMDGARVAFNPDATFASNHSGAWRFGFGSTDHWLDRPRNDHFPGSMDEVRIAYVVRSDAWIKLNYETQKENSTVVRIE
jgi:hypothetical protein